jgi:serine/threonine protein kinase
VTISLYRITHDPDTKNYVMVLQYACNGSLQNVFNNSNNIGIIGIRRFFLYVSVAIGLNNIHTSEIIHRDLHIGIYSTTVLEDLYLIWDCANQQTILHRKKQKKTYIVFYLCRT